MRSRWGCFPVEIFFGVRPEKKYNRKAAYTVAAAAVLTERRQAPTLSDGVRPKKAGLPSQRGAIYRNFSPAGEKKSFPGARKEKGWGVRAKARPPSFFSVPGEKFG